MLMHIFQCTHVSTTFQALYIIVHFEFQQSYESLLWTTDEVKSVAHSARAQFISQEYSLQLQSRAS